MKITRFLVKISFSNTRGAFWSSRRNSGSKEQMLDKLFDCNGGCGFKLVQAKRKFNASPNQEVIDTYGIWHSELNGLRQYYLSSLHFIILSLYLPIFCMKAITTWNSSKPTTAFQVNIPSLMFPEIDFPSLLYINPMEYSAWPLPMAGQTQVA